MLIALWIDGLHCTPRRRDRAKQDIGDPQGLYRWLARMQDGTDFGVGEEWRQIERHGRECDHHQRSRGRARNRVEQSELPIREGQINGVTILACDAKVGSTDWQQQLAQASVTGTNTPESRR